MSGRGRREALPRQGRERGIGAALRGGYQERACAPHFGHEMPAVQARGIGRQVLERQAKAELVLDAFSGKRKSARAATSQIALN